MFWIIGDDNRDRQRKPILTYIFILLNVVVFVLVQDFGTNRDIIYSFSVIAAEISGDSSISAPYVSALLNSNVPHLRVAGEVRQQMPVYFTLITSLFLHGGLLHLFGNMLYLFIFGDNIEDRLKKRWFLPFYLVCGIVASYAQFFEFSLNNVNAAIPLLGASGAISGVLGAYLVFFPAKKVKVFIWFFWIFFKVVRIRALFVIGIWFALQIFSASSQFGTAGGGVAYGAHIGGFVMGALIAMVVKFRDYRKRKSFFSSLRGNNGTTMVR